MRTSPPRTEALRGALRSFHETIFRARTAEFPDPLDSQGSLDHGGRYNPKGLFSALYCSLDPWVASLEVLDNHSTGTDDLIVYAFNVALQRVADLRVPGLLRTLATPGGPALTPLDLVDMDQRLPASIATLAAANDLDGLLVPSAAWARHQDDLPVIEGLPGLERPSSDPGNIVILRDSAVDRQSVRERYRGIANLAPELGGFVTAPEGQIRVIRVL